MSNFDDVGRFHKKFGLPYTPSSTAVTDRSRRVPHLIDDATQEFRLRFLQEELDELADAYHNDDLADIADALVDLVYVAMGTAHMHNLPWPQLWREVQRSNMQKERAKEVHASKRGTLLDVVKPRGWMPPQLRALLLSYGME